MTQIKQQLSIAFPIGNGRTEVEGGGSGGWEGGEGVGQGKMVSGNRFLGQETSIASIVVDFCDAFHSTFREIEQA